MLAGSLRKIKFEEEPTEWKHHRGGWSFAFQQLQKLHASDGVLCISAVEEWVGEGKLVSEPWIGFVHQVAQNNCPFYPDLQRLLESEVFMRSLENCLGLFVLSRVVKDYLLRNLTKQIPVVRILYPATPFPENLLFKWEKFQVQEEKRVLFIGEFLRNFQAFYDLPVPANYKKYLLKSPDVNFNRLFDCKKQKIELKVNDSVIVKERVPDSEYDNLLSCSIVFLNLYDAPANTTVIECISRNTPLIVNRLPGLEEYLGGSYPLFYDTLEEGAKLISKDEMIKKAVKYLELHTLKAQLTPEAFLKNFAGSSIYRMLPLSPSQKRNQQQKFPCCQYDVTVLICSYKRVYNLKHLLECFQNQDYIGTFEMIIWNNNVETQDEVKTICDPFMKQLNIRLIQSSENFYCIVRLAAVRLMQSDMLLICDDDVIPKPHYISSLMLKFKEYGPEAVICCRGHAFEQHILNEEEPQRCWEDYNNLKFFDETISDRKVSCAFDFCNIVTHRYNFLSRYISFMLTTV